MKNWDWKTALNLDLDQHRIGRFLMIRGLGVVYFVAITSWWAQVAALVGEEGLAPAKDLHALLTEHLGKTGDSPFLALPSIFWGIGTSDFALQFTCFIGAILAILVIVGRLTGFALAGLWIIYLSLVNAGGVFMSYQWDILLLEAGFLGLFLCSWKLHTPLRKPRTLSLQNRIALVCSWFLIAKLMFFSGWVKLAWANDANPEWWPEHSAMLYHYYTQPLPAWTSWHVHHWPDWMHRFSILPMYGVELVLPFFILFGRYGRATAAIGFALLMVLILSTGNYTYFNGLTIVLCLPLIHDHLWPRWLRNLLGYQREVRTTPVYQKRFTTKLALLTPIFIVGLLLNLQVILHDFHAAPKPLIERDLTPSWLNHFQARLAPFRLASGYGLFRTMTTSRPEIILEGSWDGETWFEYDFAWKVDELSDRPKFVAPHQPRLAWQFWFAALEGKFNPRSRNAQWMENLIIKLLQDDATVEKFLKQNPFPSSPPRLIRARLFDYQYTTPEERAETGNWWKRVELHDYLSPVSLTQPQS